MALKLAIGIDFGTTNSCIALFKHKSVQTVPVQSESPLTKSAIAFTNPRVFGQVALKRQEKYPAKVIYGVKRMIGRSFSEVAEFANRVLFHVEDNNNRPEIHVPWDGEPKKFMPEQIAASIIQQIVVKADELAGETVTDAVIAVPAAFNEEQRIATKLIGNIAGLRVLAIINEPTAAALAWAEENKEAAFSENEHHMIIFDMGGGTTDVTVVRIKKGKLRVLHTNGDATVGGDNIDNLLQDHFVAEIREKHKRDLSANKKHMEKLRQKCTEIKHLLSDDVESEISEVPFDDFTVDLQLHRTKFNTIILPIREAAKKLVEQAFAAAGKPANVKTLLVGGATRMKWCAQICKAVTKKEDVVLQSVNKENAVAHGAALWAAKLRGFENHTNIELDDVACSSYGIELSGGKMKHIIARNTAVPFECTEVFYPNEKGQSAATIRVYQGESELTSENKRLKEFRVELKPNQQNVHVEFKLSTESLLTVTVGDVVESVSVYDLHGPSASVVEELRSISRQLVLADKEMIRKNDLRSDIVGYEGRAWLDEHPNASLEELESRLAQL